MKMRKSCLLIYAVVFVLLLAAPVLAFNRIPGRISEAENRYLATFPDVFDDAGHVNEGVKSGFETWFSDNLGFRSKFVEIATDIRLKVFHQSTSDRVEIGRDGWYFYTLDHNVDIAAGKHVLSEDVLQDIAQKQQQVSDWYEAQGIQYILALTPGKPSVYPEYIASGDYTVRETACDQLEQYLGKNTTVQVVNTKTIELENKDSGKLFLQHDTHLTQMGAYYAYKAVAERLKELGMDIHDFSVAFSDEQQEIGDLSGMLGALDVLGSETVPHLMWASRCTQVTEGPFYDAMIPFQQSDWEAMVQGYSIFENPDAENGTLLIYGDSQWQPMRDIPQLLAESFQKVVFMGLRTVNMDFDRLVKPDVVVFGCGERLIDTVLVREPNILKVNQELPTLPVASMVTPEEYGAHIANNGICLDTCNGVETNGSTDLTVEESAEAVNLYGWAADFVNDAPFSALYLQIGDTLVQCTYGNARPDVAAAYGKESLTNTGFTVSIPKGLFEGDTELNFVGIDAEGTHLYKPVSYKIHIKGERP